MNFKEISQTQKEKKKEPKPKEENIEAKKAELNTRAIRNASGIKPITIVFKDGTTNNVNPIGRIDERGEILLMDGSMADISTVDRVIADITGFDYNAELVALEGKTEEIKYNSVEDEIAKLEKQRDAEIAALPTLETILRELTTLYEAKTGKKKEGLLHSRYIESMVNETANWFLPKDLERAKKLLVIASQYDRASEPRDYGYGPIIGRSPSQVIWDEYAKKIEELKKQKAPVEKKESLFRRNTSSS